MAKRKARDYKKVKFTVGKDPLDLRDLYYEGNLDELRPWVNNCGDIPFILDQGNEGACTGFGLAAMVNFLQHNKAGARPLGESDGASARMLYQMARRYDEWEGTSYSGSSCRGAMKGWFKHGVCSETVWPYEPNDDDSRLTSNRQSDAVDRPLGNYFRVRHHHLSHMHAALNEVGILFASADVHEGWFEVDPDTGHIPFRAEKSGGHAFAIVGYDSRGFLIQNSWGDEWGRDGFANIAYDDWLQNGFDCWVARLGVVTRSVVLTERDQFGRVMGFDFVPHESATRAAIQPHLINLGNDGRLSDSGAYQTEEDDVTDMIRTHFPEASRTWSGTPRLVLYAHGGLNNEKASAVRIASMKPYFLENEIYPIHFMWETGLIDSVKHIVQDAFRLKRFGGIWEEARDKFLDLKDGAIELATRPLGRPIWGEMKENGRLANHDEGGADLLARTLSTWRDEGHAFELHLVGHSAGSILLSHLVPVLEAWNLKVKTMSLFAPACTTQLFYEWVLDGLGRGKGVDRLTIFNLNDAQEQDDHVAHVYSKSLLYLVSEAFESKKKTPLLGMEKWLGRDDKHAKAIVNAVGDPVWRGDHTMIRSAGGPKLRLRSSSTSHGGFDNDPDTLNSMLRIICGHDRPTKPYPDD